MFSKEEKDRFEKKAKDAITDIPSDTPSLTQKFTQHTQNGDIYNIMQSSEGDIANECNDKIANLKTEIQILKQKIIDKDLLFKQHNNDYLKLIKAKNDQIEALEETIVLLKKQRFL